jgi:ketosteroid isomerase-like protein
VPGLVFKTSAASDPRRAGSIPVRLRYGVAIVRNVFRAILSTQERRGAMSEAVEDELIALEHELNDCIIAGDFDVLDRLLADEYVLVVPDMPPGRFVRDEYIAVAKTVKADSYSYDDFLIRVYGDVAVVASNYQQVATYGSVERAGTYAISDVWVRRDDRWQLVLRHSTRLPSG